MSFLDNNNSEVLTARITQRGRRAIASGNFNVAYFALGDSEFAYTSHFSGMTGATAYQHTLTPFDKDTNIKYPIKYTSDALTGTTVYGIPVTGNTITTLRNAMGPAGFVSQYSGNTYGTTIECLNNTVSLGSLTGTNQITVTKATGTTYIDCQYITLAFSSYTNNNVSTLTNSLVYKIVGVTGATSGTTQTITLDRNTPNLSTLSGNATVICNKCEMEFPLSDINNCMPPLPDPEEQHNPWTLDIVWSKKPIGIDETNASYRHLSGYTGNKYIGIKELLGYKTSAGQLYNTGTTFTDTYGQQKIVTPEQQKCLAFIHFSEIGDIVNDPDRFFKYDDYISSTGNTTNYVATNYAGTNLSDKDYFQVYLPFILYHRNTGSTIGAVFNMGTTNKKITSKINPSHIITYRDLIDEQGVYVGKIFVNEKLIVIDDEEIVATLDYKSNRKYTLPAPKLGLTPSVYNYTNSLLSGSTGQTLWLTYMLVDTNDTKTNALPCNYYTNISGTTQYSEVTFSFNGGFSNMKTSRSYVKNGYTANKFYILAQITDQTDPDQLPDNDKWKAIDFTTQVGGNGTDPIDPSGIVGKVFTLYKSGYTGGSQFNLVSHLSGVDFTGTTASHFGDTQPFPGSVKLVRASDIEEMNFLINLPSGKFEASQNPTFTSGKAPMITEIALLDSNKNALVMAKTPKPIKRTGTQVFSIKLDF